MPKYDREKVAREFDEMVRKGMSVGDWYPNADGEIPEKAGDLALEWLGLTEKDVLLDVGTGTGKYAIIAAKICQHVIGIDISLESLKLAEKTATEGQIKNVTFACGAFEDPCENIDLQGMGVTKIFTNYSLHHLPDEMKKDALAGLCELLVRPGRIVIGDIMYFDDPEKHRDKFDEAYYDEGDTDFPSSAEFLVQCLEELGRDVNVERIHPLVGVVVADFL